MKKIILLLLLICPFTVAFSQTSSVSKENDNAAEENKIVINLASAAWEQLEKGDFGDAVNTCKDGLKVDPTNLYLLGNLAHAYLFNGNYDEAIDIYRQNIGKVFDSGMTWREMIKQDFEAFEAKGFDSKSMDKVLKDSVLSLE
jgi:Tfp pilus assembly protein PilF